MAGTFCKTITCHNVKQSGKSGSFMFGNRIRYIFALYKIVQAPLTMEFRTHHDTGWRTQACVCNCQPNTAVCVRETASHGDNTGSQQQIISLTRFSMPKGYLLFCFSVHATILCNGRFTCSIFGVASSLDTWILDEEAELKGRGKQNCGHWFYMRILPTRSPSSGTRPQVQIFVFGVLSGKPIRSTTKSICTLSDSHNWFLSCGLWPYCPLLLMSCGSLPFWCHFYCWDVVIGTFCAASYGIFSTPLSIEFLQLSPWFLLPLLQTNWRVREPAPHSCALLLLSPQWKH